MLYSNTLFRNNNVNKNIKKLCDFKTKETEFKNNNVNKNVNNKNIKNPRGIGDFQ